MTLRIVRVDDEATLLDWRRVHNEIVPPAALSVEEVRERSTRNILEVAYDGDVLVGCSTVRPPSAETAAETVIARVLPPYRRRGFGETLYQHCLAQTGGPVETHILASNVEGIRFAEHHGFVEVETYVLPGETESWVLLRLDSASR
ncbi:GNAT family N-acetyltransferase [Kribbella sp. NPDC051587]|uniref:GNAT family N-acetyltransferase n=1 Tax=Kribbella sp. NPDC051587 TaxID=3364119 RepID=UPI0037ABDA88